MGNALAEARRLLGEDAIVLDTKQFDEPTMFGLCKKQAVEILAASERPQHIPEPQPVAVATSQDSRQMAVLQQQIEDLRRMLREMVADAVETRKKERPQTMERLIRLGVTENVAEAVLSGCPDSPEEGMAAVAKRIRCTGSLDFSSGQQRVALVGPTGVGKTTTAAKLAAQYSIFDKKRVALLTLDTYRVGAVEQLATYARILNIPLEVALSPEDGEALVKKHADKDLIIIDTVGRSQRNREHILELANFLRAARPTEVHLALSASSDPAVRREAVDSFSIVRANKILLTKLDECPQPGSVLETAVSSMMPFSYFTYGQNVPDDIAVAESKTLAKFIWEGAL
jgi:flagellar biosynthesis protein FlhF